MKAAPPSPPFVELPPAPLLDVGSPPPSGPAGITSPTAPPPFPEHRGFFPFASTSLRGLSVPFWCLLGYLFFVTTTFDEEWPSIGRFRPRLLLGGIALLVTAGRWFSRGHTRGERLPEHVAVTAWLVAFVLVGAFAALWGFVPGLALETQIEFTTTMLVYVLLVAIVRTRREFAVVVLVLALGAGVYLLRSFQELLNGKYDFKMGVVRMLGAGRSLADPNSFAATVGFSLPLLIWCAVKTRSAFLRVCLAVYGALALYCVTRTVSRSGLTLLVLSMGFLVLMTPRRGLKVALVLLMIGLGAFRWSTLNDAEKARYLSIGSASTYRDESSTADRVHNYRVAARMLAENPALGVGPGCWTAYRVRRVDGNPLMPHSLTGQVIATYGGAGTITFVGYLAAAFLFAWGAFRRRVDAVDSWERAVRSLAAVVAFTLFLLLVSGLAAHNVDRLGWYLLPGLLAAATSVRASGDPVPRPLPHAAEAAS